MNLSRYSSLRLHDEDPSSLRDRKRTVRVLQVVAAPCVGVDGLTNSVNGPERRTLDAVGKWAELGVVPIVVYPARGVLWREFEASGVELVPYEIGSKWNGLAIWRLMRLIRQARVQVVHTQGPASLDFFVTVAARLCAVRSIVTRPVLLEDQIDLSRLRRTVYELVDSVTLAIAHKVVFVSAGAEQRFKTRALSRWVNRHVIRNGVNVERNLFQRCERDRRSLKIGMVAQLTSPKGWTDFICVIDHLRQSGVSFEAHIIGGGPRRRQIENEVAERRLWDRIKFLGHQANIWPALQELDVFLFTSHREGLSVAVLEALAAGLPIVATDVGGIREQVVHGVNGFVQPRGDVVGMAKRCLELMQDAALCQRMGAESRRMAATYFSNSRMLREYAALYLAAAEEACTSSQW